MEDYSKKLGEFLSQQYGFEQVSLRPAPRGFFGETWELLTEQGRYLVKLDCWGYHKGIYQSSFPVMEYMRQKGIDFIPAIAKAKDGALCLPFENGILGVFSYIEGEHTEEYPVGRLFRRLARVYQLPVPELELSREDYSLSVLEQCRSLAEAQQAASQEGERAVRVLRDNRKFLQEKARRLEEFALVCREHPGPMVLTHGDAGGNCIVTPDRFTIIDWDQVMLAPPERDTWFFMHRQAQVQQIQEAFSQAGFDDCLDFSRFAYYCYHSLFHYLCEYLQAIGEARGEQQQELLKKLEGYFFSSWIFEQMEQADQILCRTGENHHGKA